MFWGAAGAVVKMAQAQSNRHIKLNLSKSLTYKIEFRRTPFTIDRSLRRSLRRRMSSEMGIRRSNPGFVEHRCFDVGVVVVVKTTQSRQRSQWRLRPQKSQLGRMPSSFYLSGAQLSLRKALEKSFFKK